MIAEADWNKSDSSCRKIPPRSTFAFHLCRDRKRQADKLRRSDYQIYFIINTLRNFEASEIGEVSFQHSIRRAKFSKSWRLMEWNWRDEVAAWESFPISTEHIITWSFPSIRQWKETLSAPRNSLKSFIFILTKKSLPRGSSRFSRVFRLFELLLKLWATSPKIRIVADTEK